MSARETHDVLIIGAGVAGALIAQELTRAGLDVLMLEAGPETTRSMAGYMQHLAHFHAAAAKGAEAPWPPAVAAPQPDGADLPAGTPVFPVDNGYFAQTGPHLYGSTYTRTYGGSTLHWLGVSLRMLPEDFALRSRYGVGRDWPISYTTLAPWYERAEQAIGVSADVAEQGYHALTFSPGYDYPMRRIPPSWSDERLGQALERHPIAFADGTVTARVRPYPAARNSIPRPGYRPQGAVDLDASGARRPTLIGERCEGNTSCTPICPVQAKYNAGKTLAQADPRHLTVLAQAVASQVLVRPEDGKVTGIRYKRYADPASPRHSEAVATARIYVLAAHAVENARLMLASDLPGRADAMGRGLVDHPALYAWGLAREPVGAFRGPQSSSGIEEFRAGPFRARHAAFRFDIGNDGWRAATGAPDSNVVDAVMNRGLFGPALRRDLADQLSRQVRLSLAVEQLPDADNRVTVDRSDPARHDAIGNPRPVIAYRIDDYTLEGMVAARDVARAMFAAADITDCSASGHELSFPTAHYRGEALHYHGMGHFAGTHHMGHDRATSVVDEFQRSWDHDNLFLVGSGSFATMGTSNPTLTLAALALRTAGHIIDTIAGRA